MKKITILILLILLLIISGIVYKCCGVKDPQGCSNLIFVAVNRIPDEDYNSWQIQNQQYIYNVPTKDKKVGTGDGIVAIDASKIDHTDYAAWLKANGDFIFYEETYPYIECVHNISEASISNSSDYSNLTLLQIKTQITNNGGNFYTDKYNNYTSIALNTTTNIVTINLLSNYNISKNCFSIPLFRSIVDKYDLDDNSIFQFKTATVNKKKTIVFRVQDSAGLYNYYDFSQVPP